MFSPLSEPDHTAPRPQEDKSEPVRAGGDCVPVSMKLLASGPLNSFSLRTIASEAVSVGAWPGLGVTMGEREAYTGRKGYQEQEERE